jgi:hypothetical protein
MAAEKGLPGSFIIDEGSGRPTLQPFLTAYYFEISKSFVSWSADFSSTFLGKSASSR